LETWVVYALISMAFAGFTSVIAKLGLTGISGELGLAIRTCFVLGFVLTFAAVSVPASQVVGMSRSNVGWLALAGATTAASWIFYYKALKLGDVSIIALIDKGSVVVAIVLAGLILKERITARTVAGGALIVAGLVVVARK
jgi:transporter family protein